MNTFTVSTFLVAFLVVVASHPKDADIMYNPFDNREFTMPESCKSTGSEYCFDKEGYPVDIIEELLKDMTNLEVAKSEDVGRYGFSERQGGSEESECRTNATTDPIYFIVDEFGRDRVVVQMKDKFEQKYSVMWCNKEGTMKSNTQHFLERTVKDFELYCENKYIHYDFLVLSLIPDFHGRWKMERTRTKTGIPVCCACKHKKSNKK